MLCRKCYVRIDDDKAFCADCGARQGDREVTLTGGKIAVLVISVLALGGLGTWAALSYFGQPQETQKAAQIIDGRLLQPAGNTVATALSLSAAEIYRRVSPSVVELFRRDADGRLVASGSGFLFRRKDRIATAYHVIRGAGEVEVRFADGSTTQAAGICSFDVHRDLAVLAINPRDGEAAAIGDSSALVIGDPLVVVGSPMQVQNTLSEGILSGRRGAWLQTSAAVSPGSSGGPLLNMNGEVVGVIDSQLSAGQNLNFALPIEWLHSLGDSTAQTFDAVRQQQTITENLPPMNFSIAAHQRIERDIPLPAEIANPRLRGTFSVSGGTGGHFRLILQSGSETLYDSGDSAGGSFDVGLGAKDLRIVAINDAILFRREVSIFGQFEATR